MEQPSLALQKENYPAREPKEWDEELQGLPRAGRAQPCRQRLKQSLLSISARDCFSSSEVY